MVYDIPDYWGFDICSSFGIIKNTREHDVSETVFVSVLR
jgi:hypothetical protein